MSLAEHDSALEARLRSLFERSPVLAAGKLQMLGLEAIRERMGERWEKSQEQIHSFVERGLRQETVPGDIFYKVGDSAYVVLFAERSLDESKLICAKLAQDICRRLFGEEEELVQVRSLTCNANKEIIVEEVNIEETLNALLESEGEEQIFAREGAVTPDGNGGDDADVPHIIAFYGVNGGMAEGTLDDLCYHFSPVWDVERHVVVPYLCRAGLGAPDGVPLPTSQFLTTEEPVDQVALDEAILKACVDRLTHLKEINRRVLLACPVHWATVSRSRNWDVYKSKLYAVSKDISQDLILCVHGIDAGVPNIRLTQELPKLAHGTRGVYACLTYGDRSLERFANARINAIGFLMPEQISDERAVAGMAREFCVASETAHIPSFAFGVETRSLAITLIGTGFNFLEGSAIRPAVANPSNAFTHETIDLFSNELFG